MLRLKKFKNLLGPAVSCLSIIFLLSGCGSSLALEDKYTGDSKDVSNNTVRIGYFGRIDESPLFAAFENGYFKSNGINVELIKIKEKDIMSEYVTEKLDSVTADYRFFQYIEEGLSLKLTAGLNAGCIRIIVPYDSKINSIRDLKNARVGIENAGDGTMVLASMLLRGNGIDTRSDISWEPYGEYGYTKAFEKGAIDAACIWEPSEKDSQQLKHLYRTLYTNVEEASEGSKKTGHNHGAGFHFTRTFTGISADLINEHPEKAIFITRAWLQGAVWVSENNASAVKISIDKGYVAGSYEENLNKLSSYMWTIGVGTSKPNIKYNIKEQKFNGILNDNLNENDFYKKVFSGILPEFY